MQLTNAILTQARRGLRSVVDLGQKEAPAIWSKFLVSNSTDVERESISTINEFGYPGVVADGDPLPVNTLNAPQNMTVTPTMKGGAYIITALTKYTDLHGKIDRGGELLMRTMMAQRDLGAANVLNLGTALPSAGGTNTMDAAALFGTHTLDPASPTATDSNLLTSSALGISVLESLVQTAGTVLSHKGKPEMYAGSFWLIVKDDQEMLARRLTGADKYPTTNDNDPNVVKGRVDVLVNPYLTSTTTSYVVPKSDKYNPLRRMQQLTLTSAVNRVYNPPAMQHTIYESDAFYAQDWRHVAAATA